MYRCRVMVIKISIEVKSGTSRLVSWRVYDFSFCLENSLRAVTSVRLHGNEM